MSEMIEPVARALYDDAKKLPGRGGWPEYDELPGILKEVWCDRARVAIEAKREPIGDALKE